MRRRGRKKAGVSLVGVRGDDKNKRQSKTVRKKEELKDLTSKCHSKNERKFRLMARETHHLTDQTRRVLYGFEGRIADEMEKDKSFIYRITENSGKDYYSHFRALFRGASNAGAPANIWLDDLTAIYKRAQQVAKPALSPSNTLLAKIRTDAKTTEDLINAFEDGSLSERECHELLAGVAKTRANADLIEELAHRRLGELSEKPERNLRAV